MGAQARRISTEDFPESERLPLWRTKVAERLLRIDWDVPDGIPPFASMTPVLCAGDIEVVEMALGPFRMTNSPERAREKEHRYSLHILTGGHSVTTERASGEQQARKTMGIFLDEGQFYRHHSTNVMTRGFVIMLPKVRLLEAIPNLPALIEAPLDLSIEPFRVLQSFLSLSTAGVNLNDPAVARVNGDYLIDLVTLTFGGREHALEAARVRGVPATRTALILSEIERNLGDPKLSGKTVAARVGITERYLQQLMEENGETFSHHLLRLRLEKAANLLLTKRNVKVAEVAYLCGFNDLSYFNRSFKKRYGESPRLYRKA